VLEGQAFSVLGFRPHTYWTAAVALTGGPEAPTVLERRRIVFAEDHERFVYHQAAEAPASAAALVGEVRAATGARAAREIGRLIEELDRRGAPARIAATAAQAGRTPEAIADILRSHALIHAAEGDFYRDVIADACLKSGLEVRRVAERRLIDLACGVLTVSGPSLKRRLSEMGATLGPPWSEDFRLATLAAWLQL
jgi:hypothetical protein